MKSLSRFTAPALLAALAFGHPAAAQSVDPAQHPHIDGHIRPFLKALSSAASPSSSWVLAGAQSSVKVDLSGIAVSEKLFARTARR